jgi:hypothetical protein
MHSQPDLFSSMLARPIHRQSELFDQEAATDADSNLRCCECQSFLVRTSSGFLCCARGHGKLIDEGALPADVQDADDEPYEPIPWSIDAPRVARRHAWRDRWLWGRWQCICGACRYMRADNRPHRPNLTAIPPIARKALP